MAKQVGLLIRSRWPDGKDSVPGGPRAYKFEDVLLLAAAAVVSGDWLRELPGHDCSHDVHACTAILKGLRYHAQSL